MAAVGRAGIVSVPQGEKGRGLGGLVGWLAKWESKEKQGRLWNHDTKSTRSAASRVFGYVKRCDEPIGALEVPEEPAPRGAWGPAQALLRVILLG